MVVMEIPERLLFQTRVNGNIWPCLTTEVEHWLRLHNIEFSLHAYRYRVEWRDDQDRRRNTFERKFHLEMDANNAMLFKLTWC